ncbi:MAG: UDP-N-acetylglucosamine 1-carboxyvinyltransferase, partial [Oscillospiraceae bacterium]|nr:UDP-N-acetylglucosamine 1-carboxyvinyltransferase [Oscillospiraceae bacterium]
MSSIYVTGGKPLFGALRVQGAKNSALPILSATVLAEGVSVIRNCPNLTDTEAAVRILRE